MRLGLVGKVVGESGESGEGLERIRDWKVSMKRGARVLGDDAAGAEEGEGGREGEEGSIEDEDEVDELDEYGSSSGRGRMERGA